MAQTALDKYTMNRAAAGDGTTPKALKLVGADALTPVLQQMIDGNVPKEGLDFVYRGRMVPVPKKNGSIRPVSVVTALGKFEQPEPPSRCEGDPALRTRTNKRHRASRCSSEGLPRGQSRGVPDPAGRAQRVPYGR